MNFTIMTDNIYSTPEKPRVLFLDDSQIKKKRYHHFDAPKKSQKKLVFDIDYNNNNNNYQTPPKKINDNICKSLIDKFESLKDYSFEDK